MPCELWRIASPTLPPRSRLYSLAPIGIGSFQVEGVTSYMMRIADAHAVSPGTLIREEICPHLTACPKRLSFAALHSLNGSGPCFVQWVEILESLTARNDLRALTLLPWRGVLSGDGVLRRYRAWCPRCYEECRDHESAVYWNTAITAESAHSHFQPEPDADFVAIVMDGLVAALLRQRQTRWHRT